MAKSRTSRLARSDADLIARTDSKPVAVVVKYDEDSIATYRGEPGGPAATSPSVTGHPLTDREARTGGYAQLLARREAAITASIRKAIPAAKIGRTPPAGTTHRAFLEAYYTQLKARLRR